MDKELIKKINRIFHDEEAELFGGRHNKRIDREARFYAAFFDGFLKDCPTGARILDIGTGTGLVPKSFSGDARQFVCTDISTEMLKRTRSDLFGRRLVSYVSCDAERLPFADGAFDLVLCNAAMHHFPSTETFCGEASRVVARGGTVVIGFEANRRFWGNTALSLIFRISNWCASLLSVKGGGYERVCARVNERLAREGIVRQPMSVEAIMEHVDIHSPNAGDGICPEKGFLPRELAMELFPGFSTRIAYHYDAGPAPFDFINRLVFPAHAPRFSLIMKKDKD